MRSFATLAFLILNSACFGQLSVSVMKEDGRPLENVTITVKNNIDSTIKFGITDSTGIALFENVNRGNYSVNANAIGWTASERSIDINGTATVQIEMTSQKTDLAAVTVTAKKPYIQKLHDRIVVNVESSVMNAGSTAYEVLERAPGVIIDPNENIGLRGKQGVIIMVDGKVTPMTGADLLNYLKGLPSNAIERIDLITNPSSRYDAAGNSGIIDIRMKKDQRIGTNGNFTVGYGQGVYPKTNAGASVNYRNKKFNAFANYNFSFRKNLNHLMLDRKFYTNGIFTGADLKDNYTTIPNKNHNVRAGMDFFPSSKTIVGFVFSGNANHAKLKNANNSLVINEMNQPDFSFNTHVNNNNKNKNGILNLNLKHNYNTKGKELTADIDHGRFDSRALSNNATSYFKIGGGSQQPDYILDGDQRGKLQLTTARIDLMNPLKNNSSVEMGLKTSFVSSDNNAKFFDASSGDPVIDLTKTNHFLYDENNNAAYINYRTKFKKIDVQLGLRAEQTNVKTFQEMGSVKWDSSYLQLFPTAFFNYHIKEEHTLGFSVSRRIDRPGYSQLNPFLYLIDVSTYSTGNPGLLPQFTWAYELSYNLKSYSVSLNYSHTTNNQNIILARFKDVFPTIPQEDNVTVQIPVNLSTSDYVGVSVSAPVKINKKWNMVNNADIFYNHFNGELGGTALNDGKPGINVRTNNNFTFSKGWAAELNANFNSGGQYGFMVAEPQWSLGLGVQKSILDKKGTIRFNVTDIFWTNVPGGLITYNNYVEKWSAKRESRTVNIGFTYRFGKNTIQAARKRTTGSEEERQRAGN